MLAVVVVVTARLYPCDRCVDVRAKAYLVAGLGASMPADVLYVMVGRQELALWTVGIGAIATFVVAMWWFSGYVTRWHARGHVPHAGAAKR